MPEYNIGDVVDSRYQLKKFLGGGRVGKVYLAKDAKTNTNVAIKILTDRPHLERERNLFLREFSAVQTLNHPGVVKVYDQGTDYFTMEYVEGEPLSKLKGSDVAQIFEVGMDITRVLEYIHRQGVIHRDLKPENIKLCGLCQVKILDFGFAIGHDVANLLAVGNTDIAGTLNYMAPEVIKGFQVDPRADLYSLGIIFYELVTGHLPSKSSDILTTVVKQVETTPPPPSYYNPKITPGFEEIILKLIAKSPAKRFQAADELLSAMMRLAGRSEILRIKIDRGRKFLYPPKFVGREKELQQMYNSFVKAMKGRGKLLLLRGEDGIGKTALISQFQANYPVPGTLFLEVECDNTLTDAWAAFGQIAYELFKFLEKSASPLLAGIQRWGQILLAIAPPLAVKSYFVGISAESANNEEVLLQGMSEFLIEISRTHPLGIFIDNMEWLDHSSLGLLNRLLAMSQDHPIFICGTYRGAGQQSSFEKLVPRLLAKKSCEEIVLERLSKQEIEAMLGSMIGKEEIQADVLDKIAEVSRGIPLLAEETIKNMADDGLVFRQGGVWQIEVDDLRKIRRPSILEDTLIKKYEELDAGSKRIIQLAAVIGRRFPRLLLEKICKMPDRELEDALRSLVSLGFLTQLSDNLQIGFVIGSPRLAELLYERLLPKTKEAVHEEVAKQLEQLPNIENRAEELAHHYFSANLKRKSVPYWIAAGDSHAKQYAYVAAIQAYQKALRIAQHKNMEREILQLLEKLGGIYLLMGEYDKALTYYQEGLQTSSIETDQNPFHKGIGITSLKQGELKTSKKHFEILLKRLRASNQNIAAELNLLASLYTALGSYEEAQALLKEGLDVARKNKDKALQAAIYHSYAEIHFMIGSWDHAMSYYQRSLEILSAFDKQRLQAQVAKGIAQIYLQRGRLQEAYRYLEEALYFCHLTGDRENKVMVMLDLGSLLECMGELSAAHNRYLEGLDLAQDLTMKSGEAYAYLNLGRYMLILEKNIEAIEYLQQSMDIFKQLHIHWAIADAYFLMGQAYICQGDYDNALKVFMLSEQAVLSIHMKWKCIPIYTEIAEVYRKLGKSDRANKMLNKALRMAKEFNNEMLLGKIHTRYALFCSDSNLSRETIEHFITAIVFWQRTGSMLDLARCYYEYGHALLDLERRGDRGFIKVALHQLYKAREIYQKINLPPMLNKTLLAIKDCEREKSDALGKRDLAAKVREFGRDLTEMEQQGQKQWGELRSQILAEMAEIGDDMDKETFIAEMEKRIGVAASQLQERVEVLRSQNARLLAEVDNLKSERDSLLTLQKISNTINTVLDSQRLLDLIMDMVIKELRAERGFLVLKEGKENLTFKCARNIAQEEIAQADFSLSNSIVKKVIKTGEAVLTSDAQADARFQSESIMDLKLRSILCVPFKIKDQVLGAIYLDNRFVSGLFTERDLEFLSAFSNQAAIAIENAFLYEELKEKERMEQELSIAARIQSGLLPKSLPSVPGIEVYGKMIPARQVGGDYYDFIVSPDNTSVSVVIGDVSGKGIPAGLVMVMARLILHHFLRDPNASTRETLLAANRMLKDNTEPFIFMSLLLARWDSRSEKFVYTGAGHENLIVCRKNNTIEVIPAGGVVLGVKDNIDSYLEEKALQLNPGDSLIFYTDGVTECMSASGEMLELDGFLAMVKNHLGKSPSETVSSLLEELQKYMAGKEQQDDITFTVIRKL